jgi:hypothetical protein
VTTSTMTVAHLGDSVSGPSGCSRNRAIHVSKVQNEHVIDDDDLLFVLAETTSSLLIYTRLGTPSRDRRKKTRVMMLLSCSLW